MNMTLPRIFIFLLCNSSTNACLSLYRLLSFICKDNQEKLEDKAYTQYTYKNVESKSISPTQYKIYKEL